MSTDSSFATKEQFESNSVPDLEVDGGRSADSLERDIDARRSSIENIVDALESKLSPGQLFDQALAFTKGNGGEFFSNLGTSIKANPVPVLLATVGVTWLMLGQNQKPRSDGPSMFGQLGEKLSHAAEAVTDSLSDAKAQVRESAHQAGDKASHLADAASGKLDDLKQRASAQATSATGRMKSTSANAQQALLDQGRNLQGSLQYMLREQPLAIAAIGIALGAAIGAALPSTEQENKLLGQTSDKLFSKAKNTMSETWDAVSQTGSEMVDDLKTAAQASPTADGAPQGANQNYQI